MGGKRSGFVRFTSNQRAMELVQNYLMGEIRNLEELHNHLGRANVKLCMRTLKEYLKIGELRRNKSSRKRTSREDLNSPQFVANGLAGGFEAGQEEEENGRKMEEESGEEEEEDGGTEGLDPFLFGQQSSSGSGHLEAGMEDRAVQVTTSQQKLLDAALEWIMADGSALKQFNSSGFKKFFASACQIQMDQFVGGTWREEGPLLKLPNANEIGTAMDRHLARIEQQRRALDEKQGRMMDLRRTLLMADGGGKQEAGEEEGQANQ